MRAGADIFKARRSDKGYKYCATQDLRKGPDTGVPFKAMSIMNIFANDIFERIAAKASHPAHYNKRSTITSC